MNNVEIKELQDKSLEEKEVEAKANYCLNCKVKPCSVKGCPLHNNIPQFIEKCREKNYKEAYKILTETTVLQPICGRICPHIKQCEGSCVRGIKGEPVSIGDLEAFVGDVAIREKYSLPKAIEKKNKKVAVIGGGPSGLTCSAFLAQKGYDVTIFERYSYLGGLLMYGIPEFRLPKEIVKETIQKILDLGVKVKYNMELGKDFELKDIIDEYDAVFLSFGANVSTKMGIEGENLDGVFGGNELLENANFPDFSGKKVAVVGGGNVAMDCARTVKRLNADTVYIIYRRAEKQMPAEIKEIEAAKEEGIHFLFQNNIVKILGKNKVQQVELIKTELIKKEGEAREMPVNIDGSNYIMDIDYIIMALGSKTNDFVGNLGLELNSHRYINVNDFGQTSIPKVFAGGDVAGTKSTVAWAAKSGREAAKNIIENFSI